MPTRLWSTTTDLDGVVAEFDSEFERLRKQLVVDSVEHRTALHGCIGAIYRMREYRRACYGSDGDYFKALAADAVNSATAEGVVAVRGKLEHAVVRAPMPGSVALFPGVGTFPGNYTYPGENLLWRELSDPLVGGSSSNFNSKQLARYRAIAGRVVLETLRQARDFYSGL